MLPKMRYGASLYLLLQRTLYLLFEAPLGAAIEVGTVVGSIILIFLVRHRQPAFSLTLIAAISMATAHAVWWIWVNPANAAMAHMPIQSPPPDWMRWRNQWEYAHLARFCLQFVSLLTLLIAEETPKSS